VSDLPPSKAEFRVTDYVDRIGRAIIIVGADFFQRAVWVGETYVLFSDAEISSGLRVVNSCAKAEAYASWLPSTDTILDDRFKFAVSVFWSSLRKRDVELARWAAENRLAFDGPLDQQAIANLHFSGEFGSQFSDVLGFSECDAIKNMLRKFEGLPQFKTKQERYK